MKSRDISIYVPMWFSTGSSSTKRLGYKFARQGTFYSFLHFSHFLIHNNGSRNIQKYNFFVGERAGEERIMEKKKLH